MVRRPAPVLLCVAVCLLAAHLSLSSSAANDAASVEAPPVSADEAQIKVSVGGRETLATLPLFNATSSPFAVRITVEVVAPNGMVRAAANLNWRLGRGQNSVAVPVKLPFTELREAERREFPWYRLRYRVEAVDGGQLLCDGVVSLSEVVPELFELRVVSSRRTLGGTTFRARVRVANPVSQKPVRGVTIDATLAFDGDPAVNLRAAAETDRDGFAALNFELPRAHLGDEDEGELKVTARLGPFEQTADATIEIDDEPRVLLTLDKSLYQPGQTAHLRALAFDAHERAAAGEPLTFLIKDEEQETVFRAEAKTSRFGVASVDWPVPESARLGQYWAKIEMGGGRYSFDYQAAQSFRVSRYELPNFTVTTTADRPYYLGGQSAAVAVRADYLFGQPVKRGRVRVVKQASRHWNYAEQKYELEEEESVEGELDESGRFIARLDLSDEHTELAESKWQRIADLTFAAYVTDQTTNRTEQRRFRLRLTKEPIHVYVNEGRFNQAKGLPIAFYVSTFYADGRPAQCDVIVQQVGQTETNIAGARSHLVEAPDRTLLRLRTNRYGVAKAVGPVVKRDEERDHLSLRFIARDRVGRGGSHAEDFWLRDYYSSAERTALRVETDKTLYRAGEPVQVFVTSNRPRASIVVDAAVGGRIVDSKGLRLDEAGRAALVFPAQADFRNAVIITAIATEPDDRAGESFARGTRTIIFPQNRELKLDLKLTRASYQPGERAGVEFAVTAPDGRRAASALGVVVFDKAIEERALTEEEFATPFGFANSLYGFLYSGSVIGNVTQRDVEQLDLSRPIPAGLETVAEMLFNNQERSEEDYTVSRGIEFEPSVGAIFGPWHNEQMKPVRAALAAQYQQRRVYPNDEAALAAVLAATGIDFKAMRDSWGRPYRAEFYLAGAFDRLDIKSDGPDERPASGDELTVAEFSWPYFRLIGERIDRAVVERHERTGAFVRDLGSLRDEMRRGGFDLDALRDRWGQPYAFSFEVEGTHYVIHARSSGPNRRHEPTGGYTSDDFVIWTSAIDYFAKSRVRVDEALARFVRETNQFPRSELNLRQALSASGLNLEELRDGWGRSVYATFTASTHYGDQLTVESRGQFDSTQPQQRTQLKPVTRVVNEITLRSAGADGRPNTADDFALAYYTSLGAERGAFDSSSAAQPAVTFSGGAGAITGTITDPSGAVIPNVLVTATHKFKDLTFEARTDESGVYLLRNLPSGFYRLTFNVQAFMPAEIENVQVQSSNLTKVNLEMQVGAVMEMVTVTAGANNTEMMNASTAAVVKQTGATVILRPQLSTPRLREFFPETLVWQPSLETDAAGRARLDFKLADNITTWKMSVIASTEDGRLGMAEREFLSFQPFFAEHDPPRILTEGDRISLPVVLRNYLERPQSVTLEMKPESWFALVGAPRQTATVPAGEAARPTFDFRAVASIKDGKQRVTALGAEAGDAIEKPVTVHPDGEERAQTAATLFDAAGTLAVNLPAETIRGSIQSELKIYPNLSAHIVEGVEAIMQRPYGCGEQTVSSAYPSVLVLDFYRRTRNSAAGDVPPVARRAERYARLGYERLLSYRAPGGGFTYWGRGEPDFALTAYALRFLVDASRVITVDQAVIDETRDWLVKRQREDGSWPTHIWNERENTRRTALQTAYIARVLAAIGEGARTTDAPQGAPAQAAAGASPKTKAETPLTRALAYLAARASEIDEPYLIASYALAAADAGDRDGAARAVRRLRTLARDEGAGSYWALETNTPFYGWGRAGRVETTALAVQALTRVQSADDVGRDDAKAQGGEAATGLRDAKTLSRRGLLFLLNNKDRHGVWLSTQATINVFGALLELITADKPTGSAAATPERADIYVNGQRVGEVSLPPAAELSAPLAFDLTPFVAIGANQVEVRRPNPAGPAQAQAVTSYYVPWGNQPTAREAKSIDDDKAIAERKDAGKSSRKQESAEVSAAGANQIAASNRLEAAQNNASSSLQLAVAFDKLSAGINQEVTCSVSAERVGHLGYGMMLAEIGLPPGADVDRASLERAMSEGGWSVSRYDIHPDRVVLYLWPPAGGVKLAFKFRPRYGLDALTAPSQLYDYYNPDARVVLAPARFVVR
jgi:hypothetical protein